MESSALNCPKCSSQINLNGHDHIDRQRYICRNKLCRFRFTENATKFKDNLSEYNLNQISAKLEAKNLDTSTENKTVVGDIHGILEFAWKLKKRNITDGTIAQRSYYLNLLSKKGADLNNPDSVETILATEKFTTSQKLSLVAAYRSFTKTYKIAWEPIKVHYQPKAPFIPTKSQIDALIYGSSKRNATFIQIAVKTGARRGELCKIKFEDVNTEQLTISINCAEKGSRNRTLKVDEKTIEMINRLSRKNAPYLFNPDPETMKASFTENRNRIAREQCLPDLRKIHIHSFRHYFASELLKKSLNLSIVKDALGHKSITSTEIYTRTVKLAEDDEQYYSATAKNVEEARKLIEDGWAFVCDMDDLKIFKKRK